MKKKKRWPILLALWVLFICMIMGIAYLSFQNGDDSRQLGRKVILRLAEQEQGEVLTRERLDALTYRIRQGGRIIAFLLLGIVGTVTIHVSLSGRSWLLQTGITMAVLLAVAYFTEKLKIYIPSRHYSREEMLISITAVGLGFCVVSAVTLTFKLVKGFFRLLAAGHTL